MKCPKCDADVQAGWKFCPMCEARLGEAAAVLGANRWRVLREGTLPLLMPAIIAAALLVFGPRGGGGCGWMGMGDWVGVWRLVWGKTRGPPKPMTG